ncbi:MAG: hypothetical protein J0I06_16525 [Planctomycetes bacterium]|nr:hypothetical protein [Planctomycetota bacterium]
MRPYGIAAAAVAVLAGSVAGQDAVEIKLPRPAAGDRARVAVESTQTAVQTTRVFGQESDTTTKKVFRATFVDEYVVPLDAEGTREKLVRTYEKYEASLDGKPQPAPPLNTPITIEKKDGRYTYTMGGKPLAAEVVAVLESEFTRKQGMRGGNVAPAKPVKPGETWNLNPVEVFKGYGGEGKVPLVLDKATMSAKLLKAEKRNGRPFGAVELAAQLPVKEFGADKGYKLRPGTVLVYTETIEGALDGVPAPGKNVFAVSSKIQLDSEQATVIYAVETRTAVAAEPLPKK